MLYYSYVQNAMIIRVKNNRLLFFFFHIYKTQKLRMKKKIFMSNEQIKTK